MNEQDAQKKISLTVTQLQELLERAARYGKQRNTGPRKDRSDSQKERDKVRMQNLTALRQKKRAERQASSKKEQEQ